MNGEPPVCDDPRLCLLVSMDQLTVVAEFSKERR